MADLINQEINPAKQGRAMLGLRDTPEGVVVSKKRHPFEWTLPNVKVERERK